jgi:hypothetical protein
MLSLAFLPPVLLQLLLLHFLWRTRAFRKFPWFAAYNLFSILATTSRYFARNEPILYFYLYWSTEACYSVLGLLALCEVIQSVFRNLHKTWWSRSIFPGAVILTILLVTVHTFAAPPQVDNRTIAGIIIFELTVRLLQGLVFVVLTLLVALLGLRWRQQPFGIAGGFGVYATVSLIATTKISDFGTKFAVTWGWIQIVAYSVTVLIWLWYFRKPEMPSLPDSEDFFLRAKDLEQYRKIIRRIRNQ